MQYITEKEREKETEKVKEREGRSLCYEYFTTFYKIIGKQGVKYRERKKEKHISRKGEFSPEMLKFIT